LRSSRTRRRRPVRGPSPIGAPGSLTPSSWPSPVPGSPSLSGRGAQRRSPSWRWHHPEPRPCPSRDLRTCIPKPGLGPRGRARFLIGPPRPVPLRSSPPCGGDRLARGCPPSLGACSRASPSLDGSAGPVAIPWPSCALTPSPVLRQLDFLSCLFLLVLAPLGTCLAIRGIVGWKEVSPLTVSYHIPVAEC
jgi:hypothetical protein